MTLMVLAEAGGQMWVVEGEEYISELLMNELPDGVSVELVTCATQADVYALWREGSPDAEAQGKVPWVINPAFGDRIRRSLGSYVRAITFTPWSAMLDPAAQTELTDAAAWLETNPDGRLLLRQFAAAAPQPGEADLQRLRGQLVLGALGRAGADMARVAEGTIPAGEPTDLDRMEIATETP